MKIGCNIWAWGLKSFEDSIKKAANLGFQGIELIASNWKLQRGDSIKIYTPEKIKSLREALQSNGLELTEFCVFGHTLNHPDKDERKTTLASVEAAFDVATELGTRLVILTSPPPGGVTIPRTKEPKLSFHLPQDYSWYKDWQIFVDSMSKCLKMAEERNLKIAMEAFAWSMCSTPSDLLRLIEEVQSNRLGLNLDTGHLMAQHHYVTMAVYQLKDRIFHTHLKDHDGISNLVPVGTGVVDFEELILALKRVGYDGPLSIEVEGAPNTEERLDQSKKYLEGILKKIGRAYQ